MLLRAIETGYRGRFLRAQDLFDELYASLADRSTRKLLNELGRVDVLLIDEMGYLNTRPEQSNAFFKLMEERYVAKRSTVITTNLAYESWYEFLGNKKMVEALLDRLRQRCHTITVEGPLAPDPQDRRLRALVSDRRPPPRLGAVVLPALTPREAEIIIDLIGQLQAVLWDAHGEAILALPTDQEQSDDGDRVPPPAPGDDPVF